MTPAIVTAKNAKIDYTVHHYEHDANSDSYGLEAAQKLQLNAAQVFKTLVVETDQNTLAVAILPVNKKLSMKRIAKLLGVKKVAMAESSKVLRSTGYVLGGVSPLGQKKRLVTVIEQSACEFEKIYVSAGKRGLEIALNATDLATLLNAKLGEISA